jgi:twinkle protein
MARTLEFDDIDWQTYERQTEARTKVRPASAFAEDLEAEFSDRPRTQQAVMFSTKLRDVIEFRPGEVTAWAGYNGHRKSMFTSQVSLDLCVQRQRTLLASFEMSPGKTLARMALQASAVARPSQPWREQFNRWSDGRLWLFDHLGRIDPKACMAVCNYFAQELHGRHVFIDSMMMVCASEESMDEQKQFVTDLCRLAQETGLHVHLVVHCRKPASGDESKPPSKYDVRGSAAISDQVSNVITVWENKAKRASMEAGDGKSSPNDPDGVVSVVKQRNGAWEGGIKLWFHDESLRFCDTLGRSVEPYSIRDAA